MIAYRPKHVDAQRAQRTGAAAVECALVTPILLLLVLGAIDVGQFINVAQIVDNASRVGGRTACRHTVTHVSEVEASVMASLSNSFPGRSSADLNAATTITVTDAFGNSVGNSELQTIPSSSPIFVEVAFTFDTVRWIDGFNDLSGQSLTTRCMMRRE